MTHHIDLSSSMKKRKSDAINVVAGKYNPRGLPPRECQCVCLKEFWKQSKITSSHELCPLLHHARHDLYYTRNVLSHILFTPFMVKLLPLWLSVYSLMNNVMSKGCNLIGAAHIAAQVWYARVIRPLPYAKAYAEGNQASYTPTIQCYTTHQDSDDIHDVVGIVEDSRFYLNCEYN